MTTSCGSWLRSMLPSSHVQLGMARGLAGLHASEIRFTNLLELERCLPRRSRCPMRPRSFPGRLLACFLFVRSLISTVHAFSGSARICSAILWVTALSSVSCASYPKIPAAGDLAGKPMITTLDSDLAKYYLGTLCMPAGKIDVTTGSSRMDKMM